MLDLVIRAGQVIDGTGAPVRVADVGIRDGRIAEVGAVPEPGAREIDASGLWVTPGWVDVHTHYDGQVTWDPYLTPSFWHGVTTVVMGNCGVGFAPADPLRHDWLISLMEGVEDIPGTALAEGIRWEWESFPEYLAAVERAPHAIDVAAQLPHAALRAYVMGERGADHRERPSAGEIEQMGRLAREAIAAGALGFSSSRTRNHRTRDGDPTPSLSAGAEELLGIARAVGEGGRGVFEMVSDFADVEAELGLMRAMVEVSGRPLSVSVAQADADPDRWRAVLAKISEVADGGLPMAAQVAPRPIGLVLGLSASLSPLSGCPSYRPIAELPLEERVRRLRDSELRRCILSERPSRSLGFLVRRFERCFDLGDPPDYEPPADASLAAQAKRAGVPVEAFVYDRLLEDEGRALLYRPLLNYTDYDLEATREMLVHPHALPGLGDGGAHCGMICDGSFPTTLLTHWGRDRSRGPRLPLEWLVRRQTRDTAAWVGLRDRGAIEPGLRADLNLIDGAALRVRTPRIVHDLPAGGKRLVQRAEGYRMTLVAGVPIAEDGEPTGELPGRLIRGASGR